MKLFFKKIIENLFYDSDKEHQKIIKKYQEELDMLEVQEKKEKGANPFKLVK